MSSSSRVVDLILQWQDLRAVGKLATPEEVCAESPELLEEFRQRLKDLASLSALLNTPLEGGDEHAASTVGGPARRSGLKGPPSDLPGYEILGTLGHGGMGVVYKARQAGLGRVVALKMIKAASHASPDEVARFRTEAEAVAKLQHANIVQIHAVGETDGMPYFSLEFCNGGSLADLLSGTPLPARDAAKLTETLARAMQVAHQHHVVHRDLKPANVLLQWEPPPTEATEREALRGRLSSATVKIADFGLAKLLDAATDQSKTAAAGSPPYMAPEQVRGDATATGPATDVYALGAVLYELLTGRPPFRAATRMETLFQVQNDEPVPPSRLASKLPRDLETICLKCLQKSPGNRYASAEDLAEELRRFQAGEPIRARPVGPLERGWRWCLRNRALAGSLAAAAACLLFAAAASIAFAFQSLERADFERRAKLDAEKRLGQIEKGSDILASIFADLDLRKLDKEGKSLNLVLGDRLKAAAQQVTSESIGDPLLVATIQNRLAQSLLGLGHFQDAIPLLEECKETRTRLLGADHRDTLATIDNLAQGCRQAGNWDVALRLIEETLRQRKQSLGIDHVDTLVSMNNLSASYQEAGQLDKAQPLIEETMARMKAKLGATHPETHACMVNFATGYIAAGEPTKAIPLYLEALQRMQETLVPEHPDTLAGMSNLAHAYRDAGQLDKAMPLLVETLRRRKAKLGADHPDTLLSMNNLAEGHRAAGQADKAVALHEETLQMRKAILGPGHQDTLASMSNLAAGYHSAGKLDKALPLLEEAMRLMKVKMGLDHPFTFTSMNNLAEHYKVAGRLDKALPLFEETLHVQEVKLGADHPDTLVSMGNLALAYQAGGKLGMSFPLLEKNLQMTKAKLGDDHPRTLFAMGYLAEGHRRAGQLDKATELFKETLPRMKAKLPEHHPNTLITMGNFAICLRALGKQDEAMPLFEESCRQMKAKLGVAHPDTINSMANLAVNFQESGRVADAVQVLDELRECLPPDHRYRPELEKRRRLCSQMFAAEKRIPEILADGKAGERLTLARLCQHDLKRHHDAALLYAAYEAQVKPASGSPAPHRKQGAVAAVLAADGQGRASRMLDEKDKLSLRRQACDWLRAELDVLRKQTSKNPVLVHDQLEEWQKEAALASVRSEKHPSLSADSEPLRKDWLELWTAVESLRRQTRDGFSETVLQGDLSDAATQQPHEVKLVAGKNYVFDLASPRFDTLLRLEDAAGKKLAEHDDIDFENGNLNSRIVFKPIADGLHRLVATSFGGRGRGHYTLRIREFRYAK